MTQVPAPGSIVVSDWYRCKDSKDYFSKILHKKRRKNFGMEAHPVAVWSDLKYTIGRFFEFHAVWLLESPAMPPLNAVEKVQYKIFISGKSGVGKTALAARLAGMNIPNMHYETTGIETTVVHWPVKLRENGKVFFFRLQLWDCGENALRRFDHLLPSCKEQVDAVLFLFSFTDKTSFEDLSNQIKKWTEPPLDRVVKLVVGTKFDLFMHCDVTEKDVRGFQMASGLPVLRMGGEVSDGLGDVAPLLNCLAENLWHRDCITIGSCSYHSQQETATLI